MTGEKFANGTLVWSNCIYNQKKPNICFLKTQNLIILNQSYTVGGVVGLDFWILSGNPVLFL